MKSEVYVLAHYMHNYPQIRRRRMFSSMMSNPATAICPNCRQGHFNRRGTESALQRYFCQIFRLFPWACSQCEYTVYSRDRGHVRYTPKVDGLTPAAVNDRVLRRERSDSWA